MRILWVSHVIPYPPKAGVLLRAHYLLKSLADAHDVDLVAFVQEPLLNTFYADLATAIADCRRALEDCCKSVTFLSIDRARRPAGQLRTAIECLVEPGGYVGSWLYSASANSTIAELATVTRYDAAHFDSISVARYRAAMRDVPASLGHHNAESHMLARRAVNQSSTVRRMYFAREARRLATFERRLAPSFQEQITCSDLDAERLRVTMPSASFVTVPNGVDIEYFRPLGLGERPNSLIFVGTMSWYPNVEAVMFLLTEVWPVLLRLVPEVTLDIVGAGAPQALLRAASTCVGVVVHGFVDDIRPLLGTSSVVVCPIRDGGGTKLKILDAFAMAKCVVAHPVACEGINATPDVNVVTANTALDFATSIKRVLGDALIRRSVGEAARRLAEDEYSFRAIGRRFVDVMQQVGRAAV